MMYRTVILLPAKEDIREAALWYNKKQKGLGKRFTFQIREKIRFIKRYPQANSVCYDDVRTAILSVFPRHITLLFNNRNCSKFSLLVSIVK
jgi:hypothetical protein